MYNQLIYFIVVLLLFSTLRQTGKPPAVSWQDALHIVTLFFFFILYCRRTFTRLRRAADQGIAPAALTRAYYRAQGLLSVAAIGFLIVYLYAFNLGACLSVIPGFDRSVTISGLAGLVIYLVHLAVIWFWSYPVEQAALGARVSRTHFIKGRLSFTSVILVPWFLLSTAVDLLQFIKTPSFMTSDFAQILLVAAVPIGFVLFGPWLIVRIWGCEPLPQDYVRAELERFCSYHNFRTGGLLLWPLFGSEMLTAGVVGILPGLRYILITSGLLNALEIPELKAVVAHEMGHVRKKHLLIFVFLSILFILFAYDFSNTLTLFLLSNRTIFKWYVTPGDFAASIASLLTALPVIVLMILYFRFIFGYFLRNSERQADLYAMELIGNPQPLISSLEKIAFRSGRTEDLPSWHHYSIRQRVQFLAEAFQNRMLIRNHNRKLYGSMLVFVALMSGLLFFNWKANETGLTRDLRSEIQLRTLEQGILQEPGNTEYLAAYGGLLFEKGRLSEAETVFRAVLMQDPENPSVLNNLAWLYATGPPAFRNPKDALELALKAAALNPDPSILDTLAEAYYINGRYAEALSTIDDAISEGGPQQSYFLKQKEKFEKALRGEIRGS